jgi:SAM-dependent methyltransferase
LLVALGVFCQAALAPGEQKDAPPAAGTPARRGSDSAHAIHGPAKPPIECPLRKHGVDPSRLRPFEEVEKYVAFLERPDRATWQKPDEVVAALGLTGKESVVDLGAGSGYFTFRLARALPQGKVVAADRDAEMVRHIHHKAAAEEIPNVQATLVGSDDPEIPGDTDLVFV